MIAKDIQETIESNIDKAFELLDEVFDNSNGTYNDLSKEYVSRPNNFDMFTFRSKLKRFVKNESAHIDFYFKTQKVDKTQNLSNPNEEVFSILASLDFKPQESKFSGLIKKRNFATFLVRGENECGQNWLIHQLIQKKMPDSERICIEILGTNILDDIISQLRKMTSNDFYEDDEEGLKLQNIAENLAKNCTKNRVIIIDCKSDFLNSQAFPIFYKNFVEHLTPRTRRLEHKIVLFLKDSISSDYTLPDTINYWCCATNSNEIAFLEDWETKQVIPYLVDLHRISNFDVDYLWQWVEDCAELPIKKKLNSKECIEKLWSEQYEKGNPYKILADLSKLLNYQYEWQTRY